MSDPENAYTLDDAFMADGLTLMVFMIQMSLEFAKTRSNPDAWVTDFTNALYERIKANELGVGMNPQIHTIARERIDLLGAALRHLFPNLLWSGLIGALPGRCAI